ncbi:hypothetical protein C8R46DRAFT_1118931 [Mycena filopes]|nr:hypothetical protein C8R46DRAFT_1118931 [Mycena filopes]
MVRFKNRWLLVEFIPATIPTPNAPQAQASSLDSQKIWAALRQSVVSHFGDVGWGSVGLSISVKYYSPTTNICIIRVARDHHKIAWGALTLLTDIEGTRYIPNVVHLSGTIKHVQLAAIAHNREVVARYRAEAKTPRAYQDSYEEYLQTSSVEIEALYD